MQTLTEHLLQEKPPRELFTASQLERMLSGSRQRRHNLVNRAIAHGELLQVRRGLYLLAPALQRSPVHPFVIAQALQPGSYISLESALAFHSWIPEAVPLTHSILPGRRKQATEHPTLGTFRFFPLAINRGHFLQGVSRQLFEGRPALVAQPLRAMLDLACLRKIEPAAIKSFAASLRIDEEELIRITASSWRAMQRVYRHKRMQECISMLTRRYCP